MRLAKDTRRFPTTIFPASGITIYFVASSGMCAWALLAVPLTVDIFLLCVPRAEQLFFITCNLWERERGMILK